MNTTSPWRDARNGLWHNNAALVPLLGLCPLLAVSTSVVNALGLGLATLLVLTSAALLVSLFCRQLLPALRLPVILLVIATLTTCVELVMQAYFYPLYQALGLFVPLIVGNCLLLDRADNFAGRQPPLMAAFDGVMTGTGFLLLMLVMGAIREFLGTGALLANLDQLLPVAANWKLQLFVSGSPFRLALLPAGAFLLLGFLIAGKNAIDKIRLQALASSAPQPVVAGSKRVRVTGKI